MTQIHKALSHYWHLRDQDIDPRKARLHVLQRFGVEIDPEQPLASTSTDVGLSLPAPGTQFLDFEGGRCTVVEREPSWGRERSVAQDMFIVKYPNGLRLICTMDDLGNDPDSLRLRPINEGFGVKPRVYCGSNPQGIMGTA